MRRLLFRLRRWYARRHLVACFRCEGTGVILTVGQTDPIYVDICGCCDGDGAHYPLAFR